jgi:GAF domain-containing protein
MLLFVDPDLGFRAPAADALRDAGFEVVEVDNAAAAREHLDGPVGPDCLVTEQRLPDGTGLELVRGTRERSPDTACILCTEEGLGDIDTEAFGDVVAEYLPKTGAETFEELVALVDHSLTYRSQTAYPLPDDEDARLAALERYAAAPEELGDSIDRLTELATELFGVNASAVGLIDEHEQRFLGCHGIKLNPVPREETVCTYAILDADVTVIEDVREDPRFDENDGLRTADIRFYASAPVPSPDGQPIGTVCVYDAEPQSFDDRSRELLALLAAEVADQLVLRRDLRETRGETGE